jgi:DNA polymerase III epsilon subunit-like protein
VIKCEQNRTLEMSNKRTFEQTNDRMERYERNHAKQMNERRTYLKRIEDQLTEFLALNKELASRYRYLKYDMYNAKFGMLRKLEHKLNAMLNVNDKRQLKALQERMHFALRDYFNYKCKNIDNLYDIGIIS